MKVVLDTNVLLTIIAANAKYIVTGDRHFNIVKDIDFLNLSILTAYDFQKLLKEQNFD